MKETIDRDLSKYLENRQMKEGCGLRAEKAGGGGGAGGTQGEREIAKQVGRTSPDIFSRTIASVQFFKITLS